MDPRYFLKYLELEARAANKGRDDGRLSKATVEHYARGLRRVNRFLAESDGRFSSVYEAMTMEELNEIAEFLKSSDAFQALNRKGNRMYSAAFRHYLAFAGDEKQVLESHRGELDLVLPPEPETLVLKRAVPRDRILVSQALGLARYSCEADPAHETFPQAATGRPYMEGHHLVPLHWQREFPKASLDCFANIVCLCPTCHRLLHYAEDRTRSRVFDELFEKRCERLARSGIDASRSDLKALAFARTPAAFSKPAPAA